jgi:hypothetical protein
VGFVSCDESSEVVVIDLARPERTGRLDLSRDGGCEAADSVHGRRVNDLLCLQWASNPDRLIALGYNGYIFIVARLEKNRSF